MDKKFWGDPENFRPERFLNKDGSFDKTKLDHVFGFGAGKIKISCAEYSNI